VTDEGEITKIGFCGLQYGIITTTGELTYLRDDPGYAKVYPD